MVKDRSLKSWLVDQIRNVLSKPVIQAPFIIWCDPQRQWRELLHKACGDEIELWTDECHELLLRHRFVKEERRPRVIWVPICRADLSYLRAFEGEARFWEINLLEALREYGVEISRSQEDEFREDLLAYALAKIDEPLSKWKTITPDELISTGLILTVLADLEKPIEEKIGDEKRHLFNRRITADFGFPEPETAEPDKWRARVVACLLATDATEKLGIEAFVDGIIPPGNCRKRALALLDQWQRDLQLLPNLEILSIKADALLNFQPLMAKGPFPLSEPLASFKAETVLFQEELSQIKAFDKSQELAIYLARKTESYRRHAQGFWGQRTNRKVPWESLAAVGQAADVFRKNDGAERAWHNLKEAISWYVEQGWEVDTHGEALMQEWPAPEEALFAIQKILRQTFVQILDRTNTLFAELASKDRFWMQQAGLPYAGEALKERLDDNNEPAAVIVVDAFRFELAMCLAQRLNGEHASPVAAVTACMAPIPTTTELGMAYVLPGVASSLKIDVDAEKGWQVHTDGFEQNLAIAEARRKWLVSVYGIKSSHILSIAAVLKSGVNIPKAKTVFLFGDEFDTQGHEGELALSGPESYLDRYAHVIRKLRDAGYGRIFLTTDHGYFHHVPEIDEVAEKPGGQLLWVTRRAVVGKHLIHKTALLTQVAGSDLECLTPRSVGAFKTYGGMGFFHRGATFQEWIIPLVCIQWAKKSQKTGIVIKPIDAISTQEPIVELEPETRSKKDLFGEIADGYLGRQICIKVRDEASGKVLFKSNSIAVSPKDEVRQVRLEKVPGAEGRYGQKLNLVVIDADSEEILSIAAVTLKLDIDEWL
ncbi:MAG: PglZ domain-containing protein [Pseudomonadota bacterium]